MTVAFIVPERGTDTAGLVRYLAGPGRHNEHTDQRVIAAADTLGVPDGTPMRYPEDEEEVEALGHGLDSHRKLMGVQMRGGHVWHCAISNPATDRELSDEEWALVARTAVERMGFTEASGKAPCRWVAFHHGRSAAGNDHIHLVVNLVREDGTCASIWNDRRTMSRVCQDMEARLGLRRVEGRAGAGMPGLSRAEIEKAARVGAPEPDRLRLARTVRGCATAAADEADFVRRLRGRGVRARPRYAKGGQHEVVGYSVALKTEEAAWFGGGRLGRDLTLPRLREHWASSAELRAAGVAAWAGRKAPAPAAAQRYGPQVWRQATQVVMGVREQLRAVPADDVAAWASAAREAAGVLAVWSDRLEHRGPGAFAAAADALTRSAQTRHGEPRAHRHAAVKDLRGVAMVVFTASPGNRAAADLLLLRQLTRLMEAIHDAHLARGQAGQAAALADVARERLARLHTGTPAPVARPSVSPSPTRPGQISR